MDGGGGGGGKADNPDAAFGDVVTDWELQVGLGGDAVLHKTMVLPGGELLATSHFPHWIVNVTANRTLDRTFGNQLPSYPAGSIAAHAWDVWQVSSTQFVASVGRGTEIDELHSYVTANGQPNPAFGNAGRVALDTDEPVTVEHDVAGNRFLVLYVRERELTSMVDHGPSKIELVAYDANTGAKSSAGVHVLPSWEHAGHLRAELRELVIRPDGSHLVIGSQSIRTEDTPVRSGTAIRWFMVHLRPGQIPVVTTLAVTAWDAPARGFVQLPNGGFDLYISGLIDGISATSTDEKLMRISVDAMLTPQLDVLGPGITASPHTESFYMCEASVATPTHFVYGYTPDRATPPRFAAYPKSGAPVEFTSDLPQRCLLFINVAPDGGMYASTWDMAPIAWRALLTSFVPE